MVVGVVALVAEFLVELLHQLDIVLQGAEQVSVKEHDRKKSSITIVHESNI